MLYVYEFRNYRINHRGGLKMPVQVYLVWLIGLVFLYIGYLVLQEKHQGY